MVRDDRNHPDSLSRGFSAKAWKNMEDPVAIVNLASHIIPSGLTTVDIAVKLEAMLPKLKMEQLVFVHRWATIKYRASLMASCEKHIIAMIERISNETEEVPDWLIAFSSIHCAQDFGEDICHTALVKVESIVNYIPSQKVFSTTGSLCW